MAKGVSFTRESAIRIRDAVLKVEGNQTQPLRNRGTPPVSEGWRMLVCKTSEQAFAGGASTCEIWDSDVSQGGFTASGDEIEVYFRMAGAVNDDWVLVMETVRGYEALPNRHLIGKTDASHAKSATGTISIWSGTVPGSLSDTGDNVDAYNRFATIASGKWVALVGHEWGWEIVAAEC